MNRSAVVAAALLGAAIVCGSAPSFAQNPTNRFEGLKLSGDTPIQIESNRLDVNQDKNSAIFSGDVSVVQGNTLLKAKTLTVFYSEKKDEGDAKKNSGGAAALGQGGSSNIDRIVAEGTVYVKSDDQVATGDRGTFDMKSQVLVMSGDKVVLTQGENVIVGCKLTVQMESGQARLDGCAKSSSGGRVKMLLKPQSQNQ